MRTVYAVSIRGLDNVHDGYVHQDWSPDAQCHYASTFNPAQPPQHPQKEMGARIFESEGEAAEIARRFNEYYPNANAVVVAAEDLRCNPPASSRSRRSKGPVS